MASEATVLTTSPEGISSVTAVPVLETWWPMTWIVLYEAFIQLVTASWCRTEPQIAWKRPSAITTPTHKNCPPSLWKDGRPSISAIYLGSALFPKHAGHALPRLILLRVGFTKPL